MKQLRWVYALAAALVVLCVVYLVVDKRATRKEEEAKIGASKSLFSFDGDTTTKITLQNEEGYFAFTWDATNTVWTLSSAEQFELNTYVISAMCNYFSQLNTLKTVAFQCENPAVYGFDHPVTLKVYTTETGEESPYVLYVGDCTPTYDAYYAMIPNSKDVFTIDYDSGSVFCSAKNMLKNLYLFDTNSTQVTFFRLEQGDSMMMELQRGTDGKWAMQQPRNYPVYDSAIDNLINTLVRVKVTDFVEENPGDLAKYGLDKPNYRLSLRGYNANLQMNEEILFGKMCSEAADELELYGYFTKAKQVFRIQRADVSFLDDETIDYLFPYCVDINIEDLASIDIDMGAVYDMKETLTLDYANGQYALGDIDIDAFQDDDLMKLYQDYYRSITNLRFTAMELDATPAGDPAITIVYHKLDGSSTTASFVETGANDHLYYLMLDGNYSGLTVRLNRFTSSSGVVKSYEALMRVLNVSK